MVTAVPYPPPPGRDKRGEATLRVYRQGTLTKLSKGGFTANWNRRQFVLIGSTLFYANNKEVCAQSRSRLVKRVISE